MVDLWLHDIESLEAVTQDEHTRRICLRMAAMSQAGTLAPFIANLRHDDDLDDSTKGTIAEIANDANFLLAVEDYVRRTQPRPLSLSTSSAGEWAILDSNQGPPPYQSGALTS